MRRMHWGWRLWPGLPQSWHDGEWSGLALALGFAVLLNVAVASSLVWTEWLPAVTSRFVWMAAAAIWLASALWNWRATRVETRPATASSEDLYPLALRQYLRSNWLEVERLCGRILANEPRDAEARLLLATMLRRTKRWPEARAELKRLATQDSAAAWRHELAAEQAQLSDVDTETEPSGGQPPDAGELAQAA